MFATGGSVGGANNGPQQTVTLTRNQLQAILQLITQVGGTTIGDKAEDQSGPVKTSDHREQVEAWQLEAVKDMIGDSSKVATFDHQPEPTTSAAAHPDSGYSSRSGTAGTPIRKRAQWDTTEPGPPLVAGKDLNGSTADYWCSSPTKSTAISLNGPATPMSMTTSQSSYTIPPTPPRTAGSPTPSTATNYHRYRTTSDPAAWEQKRAKILEYQRELEAQKIEKEGRLRAEREKVALEEAILERKLQEQQARMRAEFEEEQRRHRERQEEAERKRQVVIKAIERTANMTKGRPTSSTNLAESNIAVAAVNPSRQDRHEPLVALRASVESDQPVNTGANPKLDVCVQTDFNLLFRWLYDLKESADLEQLLATGTGPLISPIAAMAAVATGPRRPLNRSARSQQRLAVPSRANGGSTTNSPRSSPSPSPPSGIRRANGLTSDCSATRSSSVAFTIMAHKQKTDLRPQMPRKPLLACRQQTATTNDQSQISKKDQRRSRPQIRGSKAIALRSKSSSHSRQTEAPSHEEESAETELNQNSKSMVQFDDIPVQIEGRSMSSKGPRTANEDHGKLNGGSPSAPPTPGPMRSSLNRRQSVPFWRSESPPVPTLANRRNTTGVVGHLPAIGPRKSMTPSMGRKKWGSQEVFSLNSMVDLNGGMPETDHD